MTAGIAIDRAGPGDAPDWDRFVTNAGPATPYHRFGWSRVFQAGLGATTQYLMARGENRAVRGVLPLVQLKSWLFGNFFISLPYANFGGCVADDPAIEQALMEAAGRRARDAGARHVEFRDTRPRDGWAVRADKVEMIRPLEQDHDTLLSNIGAKLRAQVKRPLREGATAHRGHLDLLDDFYAVFAENMRDLGTPVHRKRFFQAILECMEKDAEIVVVRLKEQPVAAGLLIHGKDTTEIPSASSLRAFNRYSVNMYLYSECLKAAIERGSARFDFGRSSPESGTYRFKKQWGAEPEQLYWHYWLAPGAELPNLSPSNPKYELAIRAWTRLPVWLTRLIGPPIVSKLP